ncbi:hypothetical protein IJZ97_06695 [bacterium]|nr:hypothetical protein [bacterium]
MMKFSGIQVFKYLPAYQKAEHTDCKECGCHTCMDFAIKLSQCKVPYDRCKYMKKDLKIGGENVLYRHEKGFINKTVFAVVVDCKAPDFEKKLKRIKSYKISRDNETMRVDLVILKNYENYKVGNLCDETVYMRETDFLKLSLTKIEDKSFKKTVKSLVETRKKAICDHNEKFLNPVYVHLKSTKNLDDLCARASYYICKYANMLVFEDFDEAMFATLMTLRQNIFTDPQKPLQVDSKIYEFNNPDENSLVFMTTNFALTFYAVADELENLNVPSYLVVIPAGGMSVLSAWSAEKFSAHTVAKTLKKFHLTDKVKTRKIIIPGLLQHMKGELERTLPEFEFIVGTIEAYAISDFVKSISCQKSEKMVYIE